MLIHTMFPPRKLSTVGINDSIIRVGRETILRKNFHLRFTDESGAETPSRYSEKTRSVERVELDLELFLMEAVMIACLTTIGAVGSSMLARPKRKESEQGSSCDAEEARAISRKTAIDHGSW